MLGEAKSKSEIKLQKVAGQMAMVCKKNSPFPDHFFYCLWPFTVIIADRVVYRSTFVLYHTVYPL